MFLRRKTWQPWGLAAAALCALTLCAPAGAANAQEAPRATELASTMVVLDASGSMTGGDPAGGTKMAAAKRAVHALLDAAPDGAPIGLAAYGTGTGNSQAERERGCQDVTVLSPPRPLDRTGLEAAVDTLAPRGYTPIARSLQVAAAALPAEGPRAIVLVSDGVDTCAPPEPCEVARTLAGQGVDLVVHAVGFGVDDEARAQLSCIAQATGGTYTDAPDAGALRRVLPRVTGSAMRNYQPAGTPITGAAIPEATPVAVPGQYLDTIGQHELRYYAVDVPDGATVHFSATVSFPRLSGVDITEDFNDLELDTYGKAGGNCNKNEGRQAGDSSSGQVLTVATTWTGASAEGAGGSGDDQCTGGGRYSFGLTWDVVSQGVPERLPVELLVDVEPAVVDPGPIAVLPAATFTQPSGPPQPVVGGGSFGTAARLPGSGSYTDTLGRGEFIFYRVNLDWGQGLAYRVHLETTPGTGLNNLSNVSTTVYAPSRQEIATTSLVYAGTGKVLPTDAAAVTTVPVRYENRAADDYEAHTQSQAGPYYIGVHSGRTAEDPDAAQPIPIRLDVTVAGQPEPGPTYAEAASGPDGPPAVSTPAEQPGSSAPDAEAAPAQVSHSVIDNPAGWIAVAIGGAVVIALVVAVARRRAPRPGSATEGGRGRPPWRIRRP